MKRRWNGAGSQMTLLLVERVMPVPRCTYQTRLFPAETSPTLAIVRGEVWTQVTASSEVQTPLPLQKAIQPMCVLTIRIGKKPSTFVLAKVNGVQLMASVLEWMPSWPEFPPETMRVVPSDATVAS